MLPLRRSLSILRLSVASTTDSVLPFTSFPSIPFSASIASSGLTNVRNPKPLHCLVSLSFGTTTEKKGAIFADLQRFGLKSGVLARFAWENGEET